MQLPTADEIDVGGSLDEKCAKEHFLGKTLEQARALFRENSLYYLDDLAWMGPKAFCFYVPAAIDYFRSENSTGDCAAIASFHNIIQSRESTERDQIVESLPVLRKALRYIVDEWTRFDVDSDLYRNLREEYEDLLRQLGA